MQQYGSFLPAISVHFTPLISPPGEGDLLPFLFPLPLPLPPLPFPFGFFDRRYSISCFFRRLCILGHSASVCLHFPCWKNLQNFAISSLGRIGKASPSLPFAAPFDWLLFFEPFPPSRRSSAGAAPSSDIALFHLPPSYSPLLPCNFRPFFNADFESLLTLFSLLLVTCL